MAVIDLYSGIGGWTLGFKMAGVEVLSSYEWWKDANNTHNKNFNSDHSERDIRKLEIDDLPDPALIDFVVGSPPCTQFSLANRGGKGDIADGLVDIKKFLEVVEYLKPKYWAMENVPRVAGILEKEISETGSLSHFKYLFDDIRIYKASDFGVPQDRKRMIAGRFPFDLFESYKIRTNLITLGDVISALDQDPVTDPIYNLQLDRGALTDHVFEPNLSIEEERINREAKTHHPVYNSMSFPDRQDRPSRTVTALCTRVSRESIVIQDNADNLRRLTVRERGCIQSFPINYQFFSKAYASKIKMIGNAVPPVLTFFIAQSMLEIPIEELVLPNQVPAERLILGEEVSESSMPDRQGSKYTWSRSFRLALPGFRFGSGVRFELKNVIDKSHQTVNWNINFFYGNSKQIREWKLDSKLFSTLEKLLTEVEDENLQTILDDYKQFISNTNAGAVQKKWIKVDVNSPSPIDIVDELSRYGNLMKLQFAESEVLKDMADSFIKDEVKIKDGEIDNKKVLNNGVDIFIGMIIGAYFNKLMNRSVLSIEREQFHLDLVS